MQFTLRHSLILGGALALILAGCAAPEEAPPPPPPLPAVTGVPPLPGAAGPPAAAIPAAAEGGARAERPADLPELDEVAALRAEAQGRYLVRTVLFATDRDLTGPNPPAYPERGDGMHFGECVVSLPAERPIGQTGAPSRLLSLLGVAEEDPEKHVMLHDVVETGAERFDHLLRWGYSAETAPSVLLFVHGYNVPFGNACRRVAQLAYDLKFEGVPVLFSWPSKGAVQDYLRDQEELLLSQIDLRDLLVHLARETPGKTRHVIAHSLGARGLVNALVALPPAATGEPWFRNVVLAAPDVNGRFFRQIADRVIGRTERLTLYASSNDQALKASSSIHGYPRLGEAGEALMVLDGMDTIDATNADTSLLGHGYYSSNAPILSDLYGLITSGLPPERRFQLQEGRRNGVTYWEFRRQQ